VATSGASAVIIAIGVRAGSTSLGLSTIPTMAVRRDRVEDVDSTTLKAVGGVP